MITLYTAIGQLYLKEDGRPVIIMNQSEYALDMHEMLLWSSLAFRILNYDELKTEYLKQEQEYHMLSESDFDYYVNRLLNRKLIASGRDYLGVDALFALMQNLYLTPVSRNLFTDILAFLHLYLGKGFSFMHAVKVFQKTALPSEERQLLRYLQHQQLSTSELIQCYELSTKPRTHAELMEALYADEETDCDNIAIKSRFSKHAKEILVTVTNLYLNQHLILEAL